MSRWGWPPNIADHLTDAEYRRWFSDPVESLRCPRCGTPGLVAGNPTGEPEDAVMACPVCQPNRTDGAA